MKKKKTRILIFVLLLFVLLGGYFLASSLYKEDENKDYQEYTPQEEISEEQYRETIVNLYFLNKNSKELMAEAVAIDAKTLSNNPYKKLVELLLEGPKNEKLERLIPEETKINKVEIKKNIVLVDFFEGFIKNHPEGLVEESKTIYSIVNTLTELTEVDGVKILINGEEGKAFLDEAINFKEIFVRK